jgi:translation initiation factor IF-3
MSFILFWKRKFQAGGDSISKDVRINNNIRVPEVRLIGDDGEQLGVMPTKEAMQAAGDRDLDLVEVAPNAKPPVCKIMDFGKYKYQMSKKQTQKRAPDMKEVKLRPRIGDHDLHLKIRNLRKFLDNGHKVKVSMFFRGRERARPDMGMQVYDKLLEILPGDYNIIQKPRYEGNSINMVVSPK